MTAVLCTAACWTAIACPTCGNEVPPRGRATAPEVGLSECCRDAQYSDANTRHLWNSAEVKDYAELMSRARRADR